MRQARRPRTKVWSG